MSPFPLVTLAPVPPANPGPLGALAAAESPTTVASALALALQLSGHELSPGEGHTQDLWEALATVASVDLGAARAIEPQLDAIAILEQAGAITPADRSSTWGVFAAEGADDPLVAIEAEDGWRLTGTKPWCSLAARLDRALVTAHIGDTRQLFSVDLRSRGVNSRSDAWKARGLVEIPSGPVRFSDVSATAVGEPGWYLTRPGFAWGGISVAACWFGGAVGIGRAVFAIAGGMPSSFRAMHLGAIDELLQSARRALREAAELVDDGAASGDAGKVLAKRVRATVARTCDEVITRAGRALGPAPLALDAGYAKRVADLQLYVRQHHAERDEASLGRALAKQGVEPW
ncbi:MAG: hypothetical protein JWQ12_937 [Glaciihabitans sp.]|nr:hypothetical protein [Glaciihabitans sp.]